MVLAADAVTADPAIAAALAAAPSPEAERERLMALVLARAGDPGPGALREMGAGGFWSGIGDRLRETTGRALGLPTCTSGTIRTR